MTSIGGPLIIPIGGGPVPGGPRSDLGVGGDPSGRRLAPSDI